ncbi:MAG: divergent polysaccharide deacetylase family protein [Pseudomonadota bacterium]
MRILNGLVILIVLVMLPPDTAANQQRPQIAIIIDDIGNNRGDLEAAMLPGKLTFAVLPFTPYSRAFALRAHHQNKQVMLHVPMQAIEGNRLGPGALTTLMSTSQIKLELQRSLDAIPYVAGINNHMGSYFTQVEQPMQAVMETLQNRQLFYIDSRTSEFSVAESVASRYGVPVAHRHVFLDNQTDQRYLEQQWQQLIQMARKQGQAVGIGHPYPETLAFLKKSLTTIDALGVELVYASQIVATQPPSLPSQLLKASE